MKSIRPASYYLDIPILLMVQVFVALLSDLEEKYRTLVLQEQTLKRNVGSTYFADDEIVSDTFVQQLHEVGMSVVQDPKAELEDKLAGLELLRCMLRFDDKNSTTRRLGCATLLRAVLENKNQREHQTGSNVINKVLISAQIVRFSSFDVKLFNHVGF